MYLGCLERGAGADADVLRAARALARLVGAEDDSYAKGDGASSASLRPSPKGLGAARVGHAARETLAPPTPGLLGTVWVEQAGVLMRTGRPPVGGGELSLAARSGAPAKKPVLPRPGGPHCPRNLVVLYGFTKVTPEDFDFPLTGAALRGHVEFGDARFVITRDLGHKFLSAFVPTFELGKRLQAHIEKKVQGSKPQVVCADPEVLREFPIELRTGELVKPAP